MIWLATWGFPIAVILIVLIASAFAADILRLPYRRWDVAMRGRDQLYLAESWSPQDFSQAKAAHDLGADIRRRLLP